MSDDQDKQQIRTAIQTWMTATASGDLEQILKLMADDVVFLRPGQPAVKGKEAFAAGFKKMGQARIEGKSDIQEINVDGNYAYCWNQLSITIIPGNEAKPLHHAGPVLTVFRKEPDGPWLLFRDANMLVADR